MGLEIGNKALRRRHRQGWVDRQGHEGVGEENDGGKIGHGIVGHALEERHVLGECAARPATCVPMLPLAPGLFSITTGWRHRPWISSPSRRAKMLGPVRGVYGTMMVMVCPGGRAIAAHDQKRNA